MKKTMYSLLTLLFLFTTSVSAHTGLESSSPADGETLTENIQVLTLTFETVIEEGSTLSLLSENGEEVPFQVVEVKGHALTGTTDEPLENGQYTVNWRIVGEDGHLMKGEYVFAVSANETAELEKESETVTGAKNESAPAETDANEENRAGILPIIVGILIAAALISVIILGRKGKK